MMMKKVRYKIDCYILDAVLLAIILLLITAIIFYHYTKHRSELKKTYGLANNIKWKIMNLRKFILEDIDADNISVDERSLENILIYDISYWLKIFAYKIR